MRYGAIVLLSLAVGAAHAPARARWTDFAPKPFENVMYVEGFGSHESDDNSGGAASFRWNDTFFKESVTLFSRGYVYHPRFLHYRVSLTGALKQEDYATSDAGHLGWMTGSGFEYEFRFLFLPEHPYNVEAYALRYEPLYMEQSATQHGSVETNNGVVFRYRGKPFFGHAGYLDNSTTSSLTDANVKRLVADGQYFKDLADGNQASANVLFNDSWFTGSGGLDGTLRDFGAGGAFSLGRARFDANASKSVSSQQSTSSGRYDNDRFSFHELLSVQLPLNFRTELTYNVLDNNSTTVGPVVSGEVARSENSKLLQFDLFHRLYESLDSRYTFLHNNRTSSAGDSSLTAHTLSFNYVKTIPRGRFSAGVLASRNDSDNRGRTDIVSEAHPGVVVPGSFTLSQPNVAEILDLSLPSPVAPFETVHLMQGSDYTVTFNGSIAQITIAPLPPPFAPSGTYDFTVTYSLVSGEFELLTKTYVANTSVSLLDNLLTPYIDYVAVRSDVVAGYFPSTTLDSTTYTLGLLFTDGPWRARGEYQSLQWAVSPYQSWRGEVQYVGPAGPSTRIYATGSYLSRHYSTGTSANLPDPYTDKIAMITANLQQDFLARTLMLAAGGSYSRQQGRVQGSTYALNASLTWRVGKLDLSAGASGYGSETRTYSADPYSRDHQYYYFRVRRQFSR